MIKQLSRLGIIGLLSFLFTVSCSSVHTIATKESPPPEKTSNEALGDAPPATEDVAKKSTVSVDPAAKEKSKALFEAIVRNDEKKAKTAYGRAVRVLPDIVQLAVDLRFKNYDHANTVLPKTPLSDEQKAFWVRVIAAKSPKLNVVLCQELAGNPNFPALGSKTPDEEIVWTRYYEEVAKNLISADTQPKEVSDINKSLAKVSCNDKECMAIGDDLRDELLTDKFFDQLHNTRRRDSHFFAANFKSPLKLGQYRPQVSDMALLKFYKALRATPYPKQEHFLRRFKGIARDMRSDTILSRSIGDIILGDEKDLAVAKRLGTFLTSNSLIAAITRIENQLPACQASR